MRCCKFCNYFVNCTKIALTRSTFQPKMGKMHLMLAAVIRPDPLGELERSQGPLAVPGRGGGK